MRAKASASSSPKMNTSHFGILINGLQSGKTLLSMFLGTFNMLTFELENIDYYLDICASQWSIPSTILKCPRSYCMEFFSGELDENFKGGSDEPAALDSAL